MSATIVRCKNTKYTDTESSVICSSLLLLLDSFAGLTSLVGRVHRGGKPPISLHVEQYTVKFGKEHHHLPRGRVSTLREKLIFHTLPLLRLSQENVSIMSHLEIKVGVWTSTFFFFFLIISKQMPCKHKNKAQCRVDAF